MHTHAHTYTHTGDAPPTLRTFVWLFGLGLDHGGCGGQDGLQVAFGERRHFVHVEELFEPLVVRKLPRMLSIKSNYHNEAQNRRPNDAIDMAKG
jgi:hypothetical protein